MLDLIRPRKVRTQLEFAEQEIYLPNGPRKGERFNSNTQPWARLYLIELDGGRWRRYALVGCTQAGKTFMGYVEPCLYTLFELNETVVLGLPDMKMADDKWREDLLPVIEQTRYKSLLPERGAGSRQGVVKDSITFQNGVTLKFMSGGGGDAGRSGFTSRVAAVTEADKMDTVGGRSRETDKVGQIEARTDAFADNARLYLECTASFETGLIWREYTSGSHGRIACPCPSCGEYITPEREQLVGWQDAPSELDAREKAVWVCSGCGAVITDAQRIEMNRNAVLVHQGQTIGKDGVIKGDLPKTSTLGFRFNAFNNLFWTAASIASREWRLAHENDEDVAERESLQFIWAMPAKPSKLDLTALEVNVVASRIAAVPQGQIPIDAEVVTLGVDVGGWLIHYTVEAWRSNATPHTVEYGRIEVPQDIMARELAILNALRRLRDEVVAFGWPSAVNPDSEGIQPAVKLVDAGWEQEAVMAFCRESPGFMATKGFGRGQRSGKDKRETGSKVLGTGDHYSLVRLPDGSQYLDVDSNYWKSWLHQRLKTPIGQPGSFTLYQFKQKIDGRPSGDHLKYVRHLLAEREIEEVIKGKPVKSFEVISRINHYLDSTALACVGGHIAGVRLIQAKAQQQANPPPARQRVRVSKWIKGEN